MSTRWKVRRGAGLARRRARDGAGPVGRAVGWLGNHIGIGLIGAEGMVLKQCCLNLTCAQSSHAAPPAPVSHYRAPSLCRQVFKVVSCKSMDFNLYFESSNAAAMYASLSPEVRGWPRVDGWSGGGQSGGVCVVGGRVGSLGSPVGAAGPDRLPHCFLPGLLAALQEQALFPCVWLKDKDQWVPYLDTYMKVGPLVLILIFFCFSLLALPLR